MFAIDPRRGAVESPINANRAIAAGGLQPNLRYVSGAIHGRPPPSRRARVTADLEAAREWFTCAAKAGITDAQAALAEMLVNGRDRSAALAAAQKLCEQAAAPRT